MRSFSLSLVTLLACLGICSSLEFSPQSLLRTIVINPVREPMERVAYGSKTLYQNFVRMRSIKKRKTAAAQKLAQELEAKGVSPREIKQQTMNVRGVMSYEEFRFVNQGDKDLKKLMNLFFWGVVGGGYSPFIYAFLFQPNLLPTPFHQQPSQWDLQYNLDQEFRRRTHSVMQALISLEEEANKLPMFSYLEIRKGDKEQKREKMMGPLQKLGDFLSQNRAPGGEGAKTALLELDNLLFCNQRKITQKQKNLSDLPIPRAVWACLSSAIQGPSIYTNHILPVFLIRGTVIGHAEWLEKGDKFLTEENVKVATLSTPLLRDTCKERMIETVGRTDNDLRKELSHWLNLAEINPQKRIKTTDEKFNGNLARVALMSYFLVDSARDSRTTTSFLPRVMFQAPFQKKKK
eukprot:Nitzschia sp. Nitz4//scaffold96_size78090//5563//6777//NITZ4_005483-RA/size78090-processed-gene-0.18-mRNA-1//1//CDS//3329560540//9011//frame0